MTEERRLMATGMPPEDAISICNDLRRGGALTAFVSKEESNHACKCGGAGNCPDCPSKCR